MGVEKAWVSLGLIVLPYLFHKLSVNFGFNHFKNIFFLFITNYFITPTLTPYVLICLISYKLYVYKIIKPTFYSNLNYYYYCFIYKINY